MASCVCTGRRRIVGLRRASPCCPVGSRDETEAAGTMSWRGKLSQVVQELRIHCCQYSPASTVTRYRVTPSVSIWLCSLAFFLGKSSYAAVLDVLGLWGASTLVNPSLGFSFRWGCNQRMCSSLLRFLSSFPFRFSQSRLWAAHFWQIV